MEVPFRSWSPSIHYAQTQTLPQGKLNKRRLYDHELLYVSKGTAATEMNGQRYIISEGELIFLASGVYHQNEVISKSASFIGIHFDFFDELDIVVEEDMVVNEAHVEASKFTHEAITAPFLALSTNPIYKPSPSCVQLMASLVDEFERRTPGYELMCRGLMLQILTILLRSQITKRLEDMSIHSVTVRRLMRAIEANPANDWSNLALAKAMNVHEDYMAKLFKKVAGMSPSEYIAITRHHYARKLLRETNLSIEAVGEKSGYQDAHYFSRIFRKLEGIPPREYRKLARIL